MPKNVTFNSSNICQIKSDDFLAGLNTSYLSSIEASILRSKFPIKSEKEEEIEVFGEYLNRKALNWNSEIPLSEYAINEDRVPKLITKKLENKLVYIQELAVRYLRPSTSLSPGEIIIRHEPDYYLAPPAPPLIIRQHPKPPNTPEPLIFRELPPKQPQLIGRKVITISGRKIPPPPRKVVIERLPPLPKKPESIVVERWLPFKQVKRKVIFKGNPPDPILIKPKNIIIQWTAPSCIVKKQIKHLGIVRANPVEYVNRYGSSLKYTKELPQFILDIHPPSGLELAGDCKSDKINHRSRSIKIN